MSHECRGMAMGMAMGVAGLMGSWTMGLMGWGPWIGTMGQGLWTGPMGRGTMDRAHAPVPMGRDPWAGSHPARWNENGTRMARGFQDGNNI